jgi:hypothetical protein
LFWSAEQSYEHIMPELVKTGKYTEINNNPISTFGLLIEENMELSHIHLTTVADST